MAFQQALEHFPHILHEVESIRNLDSFGRSTCRSIGIIRSAVSAYDLYTWVLL